MAAEGLEAFCNRRYSNGIALLRVLKALGACLEDSFAKTSLPPYVVYERHTRTSTRRDPKASTVQVLYITRHSTEKIKGAESLLETVGVGIPVSFPSVPQMSSSASSFVNCLAISKLDLRVV